VRLGDDEPYDGAGGGAFVLPDAEVQQGDSERRRG